MKYLKFTILFLAIFFTTYFTFYPFPRVKAVQNCKFEINSANSLETSLGEYWNLDEGQGVRTGSFRNNALTDNNTVTVNPGKVGNAGQFTAANSEYLSISPTPSNLQVDGNFSVATWTYLDTQTADRIIASQANDIAGQRAWALEYETIADRFSFTVYDSNSNSDNVRANNFGAVSLATWYFVVVTRDGTNINISVNNGAQDSTASTRTVTNTTSPFRIGASANTIPSPIKFWDGRVDELGFWKKVLTAQEITDLYNGGKGQTCSLPDQEPSGIWWYFILENKNRKLLTINSTQ